MKKLRLSLVILVLAIGQYSHAGRSLAVGAARTVAKTMAGQRYLSQMTGKSLEQIGQMGLSARASALMEATKGDENSISLLTATSQIIRNSRDPELDAKTLLAFLDKSVPQKNRLFFTRISQAREVLKKARRQGAVSNELSDKGLLPEDIYRDMGFRPVEMIEMKDFGISHSVIMSRPVTQKQWVEVMGNNPSRFSDGKYSTTIEVNGESIRIRRNSPVENVGWQDALKFANRLSKSHGLEPAYDLSGSYGDVRINAPGGDIYQTEGFRLPTPEEYGNIILQTQIENGGHFYGLTGNVKEWDWDGEWGLGDLIPGSPGSVHRIVSGDNRVSDDILFRLVKTIK
ncbi:MAG: SUMF1/EgtB/PvdO family nonheme iron enzyme [Bacteriovoracales bacterium]|nr:SUMF1/EgtB/PvdO family nonheme iron enzyme [Bacteriovoracales bacterium]